ncbi:MAG: Rpn family recombination-promoting nuclease/putative transposase [Lachnospiraceae bacterium]|nr:Rpn family recombination-promoting nuclease/putative transposase [Lachnospiraceae bacterium]
MAEINLTTGKLPYRLTNDYLFRAVFQARPKALEGLCRSVLHLSAEDTISVTLQNPIELGKKIEDKEFILDLAVLINNSRYLNLEMQVYHDPNWVDRSISYTSRCFDNLNRGETYDQVLPVTHVGFLNYTLFPEYPEFHANYQLMNTENHQIYSSKFRINVIDLTQIELATEEDKKYGVDRWARVFTATTWEEINMLAQNNEYLQEAVSGVRELTEEEKIRQRCQARETNAYWERIREAQTKRLQADLANAKTELANKNEELANAQAELANKDAEITRLLAQLENKQ